MPPYIFDNNDLGEINKTLQTGATGSGATGLRNWKVEETTNVSYTALSAVVETMLNYWAGLGWSVFSINFINTGAAYTAFVTFYKI